MAVSTWVFLMVGFILPIAIAWYAGRQETGVMFVNSVMGVFLGLILWVLLLLIFNLGISIAVDRELMSKTNYDLYNITENGNILDEYHMFSKDGRIIVNDGKIQEEVLFDEVIYSDKNWVDVETYGIKNTDKFPLNLFPVGIDSYEKKILHITR